MTQEFKLLLSSETKNVFLAELCRKLWTQNHEGFLMDTRYYHLVKNNSRKQLNDFYSHENSVCYIWMDQNTKQILYMTSFKCSYGYFMEISFETIVLNQQKFQRAFHRMLWSAWAVIRSQQFPIGHKNRVEIFRQWKNYPL